MADIELREVTKRYPDGTEAVKQVNLEIGDGEFMILVGPSGCGKSTALRMIAGLEDISEGELSIGGEVVNDKAQIDKQVEEAARILDLEQHLDRKPANLSGGQRQRVAMGRAIVRSPKVFLMDEPLSNLDAKLRVQMRTEVSRIQQRGGTTTVYVTHDQTEAMTLGDRVAVMRGGIIQQVDSPKNLYERPSNLFVAGFIGSPSMNFLPAQLDGDTIKLPFGDAQIPDELKSRLKANGASREVIAGVRPEHFEDSDVEPDKPGLRFTAPVSVVESMGSELYAYFDVEHGGMESTDLSDLAADSGLEDLPKHGSSDVQQIVARLAAASRARPGEKANLVLDTRFIQLFDPSGGKSLTAE